MLSDFARGEAGTLDRLKEMPPALIALSSVSVMEIEFGLALVEVTAAGAGRGMVPRSLVC
ncbi:MAG: hypothetical protein WKH97_02125 [Casimicrobiaceae bacterium]